MPRKKLKIANQEPPKDDGVNVEVMLPVHQRRGESTKRGRLPSASAQPSRPWIPRITRLMALAIKFQGMVDRGEVRDYADIARLGYVTRARLTQIMNLLLLAPELQSALIWNTWRQETNDTVTERDLRSVIANPIWADQRALVAKQLPESSVERAKPRC